MRLIGAVSEGSGAVNEDGFGWLGSPGDVSAAWVFDGVTGINGRNYLGEGSDARWLVSRAHVRLTELAARDIPLAALLQELVGGLIADFAAAAEGKDIPPNYDPPAACLILVKRYRDGWQALRLVKRPGMLLNFGCGTGSRIGLHILFNGLHALANG